MAKRLSEIELARYERDGFLLSLDAFSAEEEGPRYEPDAS